MNLRQQKKKSQQTYNNNGYDDDDGFYNPQSYNANTYSNYNDATTADTQYYDDTQYVDPNYVDNDQNDANYTDDSWNMNEDDYYPKPTQTQNKKPRFVRPRPKKQKEAQIGSQQIHQQQPIQPIHPPQQQQSTSFRPKPPSHGHDEAHFNMQSLAAAGLSAAATTGMLGQIGGSIGGDIGSNLINQTGTNIMNQLPPGILSLSYYKYYFRVHNEYVLSKLTRLLLPFLKMRDIKDWKRKKIDEVTDDNTAPPPKIQSASFYHYTYQPPIYDINAPDGYLPLMAVITYIVIMGFVVGTRSSTFSPQILIATGSSAFIMLLIEVLLMKIGFYLIGSVATPPYWLDIVCYTGYKLVFVTINLIINLIFDSLILYYIISVTTGTFAAIFMIQTLRPYFRDLSEFASGPLMDIASNNEPKKTRKIFLGIVGIAQIFFIQLMGRYTSI